MFLGYVKISVAFACLHIKPKGKSTKDFVSELIATYQINSRLMEKQRKAASQCECVYNQENVSKCDSSSLVFNQSCNFAFKDGSMVNESKIWQLIHASEIAENCNECVKALMTCSEILSQFIGQKLSSNCIKFLQKAIVRLASSNPCQRIILTLISVVEQLLKRLLFQGDTFEKLLSMALISVGTGHVLAPMVELLLHVVKECSKHVLQQKLLASKQLHINENICYALWVIENLVPKLTSSLNDVNVNSCVKINCSDHSHFLDSSNNDNKHWNTLIDDLYSTAGRLINKFPLTAHYVLHIASLLENVISRK